jgi:hypothetical protein
MPKFHRLNVPFQINTSKTFLHNLLFTGKAFRHKKIMPQDDSENRWRNQCGRPVVPTHYALAGEGQCHPPKAWRGNTVNYSNSPEKMLVLSHDATIYPYTMP